MDIIPAARAVRYEQLEAGEFFLIPDARTYGLKCKQEGPTDRNKMVVLGPSFFNRDGSFLLGWQAVTVLSFGKSCSILLPSDPSVWGREPLNGPEPWVVVAEDRAFFCTNAGPSRDFYVPCFVDVQTGEIIDSQVSGVTLCTKTWEIAVLSSNHPPRTILKYPSPE